MRQYVLFFWLLLLPAHAMAYQPITQHQSNTGYQYWLMEEHQLPFFVISIGFKKAGSAYDHPDSMGLAYLTASMLLEGAGNYDAAAFAKALETHAISLSFHNDKDFFYIHLKTLTKHKETALSLLNLALTAPQLSKPALLQNKEKMRRLLERQKENPSLLAEHLLYTQLYPNHPYAKPPLGTEKTIRRISIADIQSFVKNRLVRDQMFISVVGNINAANVTTLLDNYLDLPQSSKQPTIEIPTYLPTPKNQPIYFKRPAAQDVILFALPGVMRHDPDFYASYVANFILGGGSFSSILMQEVREKRGLAYSIYTALEMLEYSGFIYGSVGAKDANTTLEVIHNTLKDLHTNGVSDLQVEKAKSYIMGSFPLKLDKNQSLANMLLMMQLMDLGHDYLIKRNNYFTTVTTDAVNRAIKRLFKYNRMLKIVVGKTKT